MPYESNDNTWVNVSIEMNLDRMEYSRSLYTAFDLLADVGGLSGMFIQVFFFFVQAWNFNALDKHMVARLFRIKKKKSP